MTLQHILFSIMLVSWGTFGVISLWPVKALYPNQVVNHVVTCVLIGWLAFNVFFR